MGGGPMNTEKRFAAVYGSVVVATVVTVVAALVTHRHWVTDLGTVMLCLALQGIILYTSALALVNQPRMISGRRLFYARFLLILIIASAVGAITYVQVLSLARAWMHYS